MRNTNNLRVFNSKKLTALILAVSFAAGLSGCNFSVFGVSEAKMKEALAGDFIYNGISIDGTDVSGMTEEECIAALKEKYAAKEKETLFTAAFDDKSWDITPQFLGTTYDYAAAAKEAFSYARGENLEENYESFLDLEENPLDVDLKLIINDGIINNAVDKIAEEIDVEAVNAAIERTDSGINITQDVTGYAVNKQVVAADFKDMLENGFNGAYEIITEVTEPELKKADFDENFKVMGAYNTSFSGGDWGRNENIRLAASNINGTVVQPGEVFSSYQSMGEQTLANGYQYAGVIENGVLTSGVGGGVCQVSTTLYNAVIRAELEVVERKNHSLKIGYVPAGMDAAIAGTYTDFKFKNNTEYPVYVEMYTENNKLYANIYGYENRPAGRTVDFESVYVSSVGKPAEQITYDPDLPEGERIVTKSGNAGSVVDVYKLVYLNGNLESREYFNRSTYRATADQVTIGQKKVEETEEPSETAFSPQDGEAPAENTVTETPAPVENNEPAQVETPVENTQPAVEEPQFELIIDENGEEIYVPVG